MRRSAPHPELILQAQPSRVSCVQTCLAMALDVPVERVMERYGRSAMNKEKLWDALRECGVVANMLAFSEFVHTGWYFVTVPSKRGHTNHQLLVHVDVDYGCSGFTVLDPLRMHHPDKAYAADGSDLKSWSDLIAFVPGGTLKACA
jgi:hypothetical protein